jgi:hypothetical protein
MTPREELLAAKQAVYDANFRNDAGGLRAAASKLDALATDRDFGARALYYAGWTRWSLAAAQLQANEREAALASLSRSVEDLRKGLALPKMPRPRARRLRSSLCWTLGRLLRCDA